MQIRDYIKQAAAMMDRLTTSADPVSISVVKSFKANRGSSRLCGVFRSRPLKYFEEIEPCLLYKFQSFYLFKQENIPVK